MSETKKIMAVVLIGVAVLFFLTTNILLPISRKNKKMAAQYTQLQKNVKAVEKYKSSQLDSWELSLKEANEAMERKFIPEGKVQLTEQLTEVPSGSEVVFSNISYRAQVFSSEYQISAVDVNAKAPFYDFITYLTQLEKNELIVGIQSFSLHNTSPGAPLLEIRVVFLSFRLLDKSPSITKYITEKYLPIDEGRLTTVLEPIKDKYRDGMNLVWEDFDPFFSTHDFNKGRGGPAIEEVTIGAESSGVEDLQLKGILRLRDKKVALINDRILKEGERISGAQVVEIQDYLVVLKYAGKEYILKMGVESEFNER